MSAEEALESPPPEGAMTFKEHLRELRRRLVRIVGVLVIGFFFCWHYRLPLFEFLSHPIADALADNGIYQFRALQLTESVVVYLKTALIADIFILSPYIFYEMWGFVSPGLYSREKRFVLPLTAFSVFFFVIGAAFAYLVLLPFVTDWLVALTLEGGHVDVLITIANTYSFAFTFLLMFGLVFELPLVLFFLALWGVVNGKGLLKFWRYFVVISFVLSGMFTPPDPISQLLMAVPLNGLYGLGVLIAFAVSRAREQDAANAGGRALRAMAVALLAISAVVAGVFVLIQGLPQKPLAALAPKDTALAVGFNPRVLMGERAVAGLLRGDDRLRVGLGALEEAGADLATLSEGLWAVDATGQEVLLLRGGDAPKLAEALSAKGLPWSIAALDDDTLALGAPALVTAALAGEVTSLSEGSSLGRVLRRTARSGPAWAWLPAESPLREALLGPDSAAELGVVTAAVSLTAPRQLLIDIPLSSEDLASGVADRVTARLETARVMALANPESARELELLALLDALAAEVEALPRAAGSGSELGAIRARIDRLRQRPEARSGGFPALVLLANHLRGVSVRLDESRIHVSAEIADSALDTFIALLPQQPHRGADGVGGQGRGDGEP